jgi:lipopolysaccharide export LptBFGC system permease protein LptF
MVFKRVDRYITVAFLLRFLGALLIIGALYATFDLLKRLEDIRQEGLKNAASLLLAYYGRLMPMFLLDVVPGIVLMAAGMVVVHMAKARELLALKASGTSLYRVMAPIFLWTFLISIGMFGAKERYGPRLLRQGEMLGHVLDSDVENQLLLNDPQHYRKVFIGRYDFTRRTLRKVTLLDFYPDNPLGLKRSIQADSGQLLAGGILSLRTAEVQQFDPSGTPNARPTVLPRLDVEVGLSPMDILSASEDNAQKGSLFQTLPELRTQMRLNPEIPFFAVSFHTRLAAFFSPLILLLVGLPCLVGFERSVNSRFLSVIVSMGLAAGLYVLTFVFNSMGTTGALNPVLAGWLPAIISAVAGLWLFQSMMT